MSFRQVINSSSVGVKGGQHAAPTQPIFPSSCIVDLRRSKPMKKTAALSILTLTVILNGALVHAQDATPAATDTAKAAQKYTQAELDASPYLKSVVTREGTMADTSKF